VAVLLEEGQIALADLVGVHDGFGSVDGMSGAFCPSAEARA
jgi:hypothetical protein